MSSQPHNLIRRLQELDDQGLLDDRALRQLAHVCDVISGHTNAMVTKAVQDVEEPWKQHALTEKVFQCLNQEQWKLLTIAVQSTSDPITSHELAEKYHGASVSNQRQRNIVHRIMTSIAFLDCIRSEITVHVCPASEIQHYKGEASIYNYTVHRPHTPE